MIDNYDSFTYNLVHYLRQLGAVVDVYRNDQITAADALSYQKIVLSPGPGLPKDAGIMPELLKQADNRQHILGVCLGHQAIAENAGASLVNLAEVFHGVATDCEVIDPQPLFEGLPAGFKIGRYHSWSVVNTEQTPLKVTAIDKDSGAVMAIKHSQLPQFGVQFHPESILTEHGMEVLNNFLKL